jgi:hypothetical protein
MRTLRRLALASTVLLGLAAGPFLLAAPAAHATVPPTVCDAVFTVGNPGAIATGTNSGAFTLRVNAVTCAGPSLLPRDITVAGSFSGAAFTGQWHDTAGCNETITGAASGVSFNGTMSGTCGSGAFSLHWTASGGTLHADMT